MDTLIRIALWLFQFIFSPVNLPVDNKVSNSYYYGKYIPVIYYCQDGNWFELGCHWMPGASLFGLRPLAQSFAKDGKDIYFKQYRVTEWVDYSSFSIIRNTPTDKNHVYYMSDSNGRLDIRKIAGADPKSFEEVSEWDSGNRWLRDNRHYYLNERKSDVDRNSFTQVCAYLYKDKSGVYTIQDNELKRLPYQANRFRRLTRDSCTDENSVVRYDWRRNKLESYRIQRGPNSIIAADENYLIYGNRVIYHGISLPMAEAASFSVLSEFYAKDRFRVYFDGKPLKSADPSTFSTTGLYTGKDKNASYCRESQVQHGTICK